MRSKPSGKRPALRASLTLTVALLSALSLSACATPPSVPTLTVPATLRKPCVGPTSPLRTQADDDALKVRYEETLKSCSARGDTLVEMIDGANKVISPPKKKWLPF